MADNLIKVARCPTLRSAKIAKKSSESLKSVCHRVELDTEIKDCILLTKIVIDTLFGMVTSGSSYLRLGD